MVKVKGLKNPLGYWKLKSLLYKNEKLEIKQDKWYRYLNEGYINIINEIYSLSITENKREIIYDSTDRFVNTMPLMLQNGVLQKQEPIVLNLFPLHTYINKHTYKDKPTYRNSLKSLIHNNKPLNKRLFMTITVLNINKNLIDHCPSINSVAKNMIYLKLL